MDVNLWLENDERIMLRAIDPRDPVDETVGAHRSLWPGSRVLARSLR